MQLVPQYGADLPRNRGFAGIANTLYRLTHESDSAERWRAATGRAGPYRDGAKRFGRNTN